MRPHYTLATLLAVTLCAFPAFAQEGYHGRVSFVENDGLIRGTDDDDWSYATVNSLVLPGDTVWADSEGVLELEFSGGTFVRLADASKLEVASIPPSASFRGWNGSFYVQRIRRGSGQVTFQTPAGALSIEPNTQVRLDILTEGQTSITVRWGRAVIATESGEAIEIVQGQRTYIDPGYLPSIPEPFDRSFEDDFDAWNRERARLLAVGTESVPIINESSAEEIPVGVSDLNGYGDWVYVDDDYYWRPTVIHEYVPYRNGYWSYAPHHGYSWVGHYPFSYVTSHYGFWDYHDHYGWLWKYNHHYRPAYAATLHYGNHFIWTPLGFRGHPVHYGHDYFTAGGVRFSIHGSSYSLATDLLGGHYGHQVHGLTPRYFNGIHADQVNIWNININGGRYSDTTYRGTTLPVRDYSPRRVLRGPDRLSGSTARLASARATTLEAGSRNQFRTSRSTATRSNTQRATSVRTQAPRVDSARSNSLRSTSLRATSRTETQRALRHAERTTSATRSLMSRRAGGVETLSNSDVSRSDALRNISTRSPRSTASTSRDTRSTTRTTSPRGESTRDESLGTVDRATRVPGQTLDAGERRASPNPDNRRTTREAITTVPEPRSERQTFDRQQPTPRTTRTTVPDRSFDSALPDTSRNTRSPSRVSTPSNRGTDVRQAPSRSEVRTAPQTRTVAPRSDRAPDATVRSAPSRDSNITRSAPRQSAPRQSAPQVRAPQQSAPRVSTPQRSAPQVRSAPRVSAPQRSAPRSAPQVRSTQRSTPRVSAPQRSAPRVQSSSPSRSIRPSSTPRSSSRMSAPRPSSSRSSAIGSSRSSSISRGSVSRGSSPRISSSRGSSSRGSVAPRGGSSGGRVRR